MAHQCWRTICQASSASYDFVYRTVQADWERIRANREYNDYRAHLACFPSISLPNKPNCSTACCATKLRRTLLPARIPHDRAILQIPRPTPKEGAFVPTPPDEMPDFRVILEDPNHPDGYHIILDCPKGRCPENPPVWVDPREPKPAEDTLPEKKAA